ncbi:AgmX/PglI C-terminal domain-containing protein [Bdellovibrio sp. HCB2-146]|uniref:AgmX/PglI C-terminal domain-containing protein n=1 Tax=Bdellovibrio sp. HCB2-146 TaxID=3394362 RepID=UPI0039BD28B7
MLTLMVRQSLKNGTVKTWKLRSNKTNYTFGSSRLADMISISADTKGLQGMFEFRDNKWWYVNLDMNKSAELSGSPAIALDKDQTIDLGDCTLALSPVLKQADLFLRLEKAGQEARSTDKKFQLFMVRQAGKVVETKLLPLNKKFKPTMALTPVWVTPVQTTEWKTQMVGELEVSQRTISLEDASKLGHMSMDQVIDKDSKKGVYALLGVALLMVTVSIFSPKKEVVAEAVPPKPVQKIVVKTELKPKKKRQSAPAPAPQQQVVQQKPQSAPAVPNQAKVDKAPPAPNKVAGMLKSLNGGRISQLLGKVSAQAAKSGNIVVANGIKAGSGPSGRGLAAVGNIERSGRDWGNEGTGGTVVIGTAGRGGGKSASGMGGLAAGGTGSGGVGLIEEESEITGGLDRDIIAQYIKSQLGQILYCYERQLSSNAGLYGKVAVKFTIGPSGKVEQQLIGNTTLKNATVEGCILNKVAAWKFPAPQGGTRVLVTYPFLFKSTN